MTALRKSAVLIVACLCIAGSLHQTGWGQVAAAGKVLRWKLQKGQSFDVLVEQEMTQKQNISGQQMDTLTKMRMEMSWDVVDVDADGNFSVGQSMDRIVVKSTTPMGEVAFDSASEEPPQGMAAMLASTMRPMVGAKFVQKITPLGATLDVEAPEDEQAGGAQGPMSPEMVKQMMSNATLPVPKEGVEAGTTWTDESTTELPVVGAVNVSRTFVYEGEVERDSRKLDAIKMTMESDFGKGGTSAMGMKMTVKDQETDGKLYFDTDAGYLTSSEITQKMNMTIEAMGQNIDQEQTSKIVMTITPR